MSKTDWQQKYSDLVQTIALTCDVGMRLDLPAREIVARIRSQLDRAALSAIPARTDPTQEK